MRRGKATNLAPERTRFVGRDAELALLAERWERGERLVTLVGPGGAGKTRLARHFAVRLVESKAAPGGVWFCDLAEAKTREDVLARVSTALGAPLAQGSSADDAATQIAHALSARQPVVVVLDNFEQIVDHATSTVGQWREHALDATFLVTSRTRLRIQGESVIEVGPLPEAEAVELFEERARRTAPSFRSADHDDALRALVHHLDRHALAIELAAARVNVLPPAELLERLSARLDLLRTTDRDAPARHASLRNAIDGSWDLLEDWEKDALAQCSVFQGTFSLEAAEAVIELEGTSLAVVDVLESLVEQSLIVRDDEAHPGTIRFRLLESVRDYAAAKLSLTGADRADAPAARHTTFFLGRVEAWAQTKFAPWGAASDDRILRELDNLMAIARRAEGADPVAHRRVAIGLDAVLTSRGPAALHRSILDAALRTIEEGAPPDPVACSRLLIASANAHRVCGRLAEGRADLAHAGEIVADPDPDLGALSAVVAAHLELDAGRMDAGRVAADRALEHARRADDPRVLVVALHTMARLHVDADELGPAREACDRAQPLARRSQMPLVESRLQNLLGVIAVRSGRLEAAEHHYSASLDLARDLGEAYMMCTALVNLADVCGRRAEHEGARARYEEALEMTRLHGFRRAQGLVLNHLGLIAHDRGEVDRAGALHEEAWMIHREVDNVRSEAFALEVLGLLELERGHLDEALARLGRSVSLGRAQNLEFSVAASGAYRAVVLARLGRHADARESVRDARRAALSLDRSETTTLVALGEAAVRVSLDPAHGAAEARAHWEAAAAVAGQSARVRVLRRIVDRLLHESIPRVTEVEPLAIGDEARWFRRGEAEAVDLSRRRSLRLMLLALARVRAETPGAALSLDALFEAGWPGENIPQGPAYRRVYTAIGMLRDLGLREVLVRRDDGYLLAPSVPVVRAAGPSV